MLKLFQFQWFEWHLKVCLRDIRVVFIYLNASRFNVRHRSGYRKMSADFLIAGDQWIQTAGYLIQETLNFKFLVQYLSRREISKESFRRKRRWSRREKTVLQRRKISRIRGFPKRQKLKSRKRKLLLWRRNFLENEIVRGGEGKLLDAIRGRLNV